MKELKNNKLIKYMITALLGISAISIYFLVSSIEVPFLNLLGLDYTTMSTTFKVFYLIIFGIITMCLIMLVLNKKISKDIKNMKLNHKEYFKKYFKFWLISIGIMMISNFFINFVIGEGVAGNEETLREMFKISPIYIFFSSVIYAPVVEELVFRQGIRNIIPNKIIFIFVSGIVFGGLHVIGSYSGPADLLYLIPYCAPGIAFAYILADSDNVLISMGLHFMHNGILIALQFLLLFFS